MDNLFLLTFNVLGRVPVESGQVVLCGNSMTYAADPPNEDSRAWGYYLHGYLGYVWENILPQLPISYNLYEASVNQIRDPLLGAVQVHPNMNGARDEERLPTCSVVFMWLDTAKRGRQYQGRKTIGPVCASDAVDGVLTATAAASWSAIANLFTVGFQVEAFGVPLTTFTPVIHSYQHDPLVIGKHLYSAEPVTGARLRTRLSVKRHRLPRYAQPP